MAKEKKISRRDVLKYSAAGAAGACVLTNGIPAFAVEQFPNARASAATRAPSFLSVNSRKAPAGSSAASIPLQGKPGSNLERWWN